MILTKDMIDVCKTEIHRAFTGETIRWLKPDLPLVKGWTYRLVGKEISEHDYQMAVKGRTIFASKKINIKPDAEQTLLKL
jgi:hypothetical protein